MAAAATRPGIPRLAAVIAALACSACTSIAADSRTFEGTRWSVTEINGRQTPRTGNYQVQFQRGQLGGRLGCNQFGGAYRVRGDVMTVGPVAATEMACDEPHMSFEGAGFRVLQQPMRMTWPSGGRLLLSNASGSIGLQRAD